MEKGNNLEKMEAKEALLSLEMLLRQLSYADLTGLFVWKVGQNKGRVAGYVNNGYIRITLKIQGKGTAFSAHRLAWLHETCSWPTGIIDHLDQVRSRNLLGNLTDSTNSKNQRNKKKQASRSGHTGVRQTGLRWLAQISVNRKAHFSKTFPDIEQAIEARALLEEKHGFSLNHGQQAPPQVQNVKEVANADNPQAAMKQLLVLGYDPEKVRGVYLDKLVKKFRANIRINKKAQHIGHFKNHKEAVFARYCYELLYKQNKGSEAEAYVKRHFANA